MADSAESPSSIVGPWLRRAWSPVERAALIAVIAIAMASLFLTTYSLALGDPVPHRINTGFVGTPGAGTEAIASVQHVARHSLHFQYYPNVAAALHAIAWQQIYAAISVSGTHATLYVASAAGASVARVLERSAALDPNLRIIDTHPLLPTDPSGLDLFYLMLVTTVVGFVTVFQIRVHAPSLTLRHHVRFVASLAIAASLVLTIVDSALLHKMSIDSAEEWAILALHLTAVSSFTLFMMALIGRWAIVPTWSFFVILGNTASGGAVSPPLLPQPFAFLSSWLPSGATVTSLRDVVYFHRYQHVRPIAVLASWSLVLLISWVLLARWREAQAASATVA